MSSKSSSSLWVASPLKNPVDNILFPAPSVCGSTSLLSEAWLGAGRFPPPAPFPPHRYASGRIMEAKRELVHQQDRSSFRSANCPLTDTSYPPRCKPSVVCCPYSPSCLEEVFSETQAFSEDSAWVLGGAGFLRLFWCGDGTDLLHQAQGVPVRPLLDDLVLFDAMDSDPCGGYLIVSATSTGEGSCCRRPSKPASCMAV